MGTIKRTLFTGWSFMRWLRLLIGIFFTIQGIQSSDALMGVVGIFFLFTAATNTGCCGAGGCSIREQHETPGKRKETVLDEMGNP